MDWDAMMCCIPCVFKVGSGAGRWELGVWSSEIDGRMNGGRE